MKNKLKKKLKLGVLILFLLAIGFIAFLLNETKDEVNADFDNISEILNKLRKENKNAGFAVSVFSKDTILFQKGFGFSNLETQAPYSVTTEQYIASVSKTTIGIALMKAQELGLLNLDDPINDHLPFVVKNPNFPDEVITIKQLSTHTSSLDYNEKVVESLYVEESVKEASLASFFKAYFQDGFYGEVTFMKQKPGAVFNYSNIGGGLAAYIIERASNMTFDIFSRKYIFEPLQMNRTHWFLKDSTDMAFQTKYYEPNDTDIKKVKTSGVVLYPSRDLITNIQDLTKLYQAILAKSPLLLKSDFYDLLLEPQLDGSVAAGNLDNTGIFWMIDRNKYGITYQLTGMNGGDNCITTIAWLDKKTGLAYLFIGNTGQEELNRANHIVMYRSLVSLGDYYIQNNPNSNFSDRLKFRWHNVYSRIRAFF